MPRSHLLKLVSLQHIRISVQRELAGKTLPTTANGCAPEWAGAADRYCGFLTANECDEVCAAIKSTPRVDATLVAIFH